jgi:hypothetical protein
MCKPYRSAGRHSHKDARRAGESTAVAQSSSAYESGESSRDTGIGLLMQGRDKIYVGP